jgi:hypothetical protein
MRPRRLILCLLSGLLLLARCCAVAGQRVGGRRRLTSQGASSLTLHMFDAYPAYASYPDAVCNDGTPGAWTSPLGVWGRGRCETHSGLTHWSPSLAFLQRWLLLCSSDCSRQEPLVGGLLARRRRVRARLPPVRVASVLGAALTPNVLCAGVLTAPAARLVLRTRRG